MPSAYHTGQLGRWAMQRYSDTPSSVISSVKLCAICLSLDLAVMMPVATMCEQGGRGTVSRGRCQRRFDHDVGTLQP